MRYRATIIENKQFNSNKTEMNRIKRKETESWNRIYSTIGII